MEHLTAAIEANTKMFAELIPQLRSSLEDRFDMYEKEAIRQREDATMVMVAQQAIARREAKVARWRFYGIVAFFCLALGGIGIFNTISNVGQNEVADDTQALVDFVEDVPTAEESAASNEETFQLILALIDSNNRNLACDFLDDGQPNYSASNQDGTCGDALPAAEAG